MTIYWGVVSSQPANVILPQTGNLALFDFVTTQQGTAPQFWGRYIAGKPDRYLLTAAERDFLYRKLCRILLIHYGVDPCGSHQQGARDATNAVNAAQTLHAPAGVSLYGDIETKVFAHPDWLLGWWETMSALYLNPGGFYCNTSPENALYFSNPYCAAITSPSNLNPDGTLRFNPPLSNRAVKPPTSITGI